MNKTKRTNAIDFYRILFTFLICVLHFEGPFTGKQKYFMCCYLCVEFFFILSGFYLNKKLTNDNKDVYSIEEVIIIILKKIKKFYIYYAFFLIIILIRLFLIDKNNFYANMKNSGYFIWEFSMLQSLGMNIPIFNFPLWFFSALLIATFLFLLLYRKGSQRMTRLFPVYIYLYLSITIRAGHLDWWGPGNLNSLFIGRSIIRAFAGLGIGYCSYEVYLWLMKVKYEKSLLFQISINLLYVFSLIISYKTLIKNTKSVQDLLIIPCFSCIIIFSEYGYDLISKYLSKIDFSLLENLTFSVYCSHSIIIPIAIKYIHSYDIPVNWKGWLFYLGLVFTFSFVSHYFIKYFISKFKNYKFR